MLFRLSSLVLALICCFPNFDIPSSRTLAQSQEARVTLTPILDYLALDNSDLPVRFDGLVSSAGEDPPDLSNWGFHQELPPVKTPGSQSWSIRGSISTASLTSGKQSGQYHLRLGPLELEVDDQLTLVLPFVDIDHDNLNPTPTTTVKPIPERAEILPRLVYQGEERPLTIDIPFTPVRKQIGLTITPLFGEMITGRTNSFRLSGHVVFDKFRSYETFNLFCRSGPRSGGEGFRPAYLMYSLDQPPVIRLGAFSSLYSDKSTYAQVRAEVLSCEFDRENSQVEATFNGRAFAAARRLPDEWRDQDVFVGNRKTEDGAYRVTLGNIMLGPGDSLAIAVTGANLRSISPAPTRLMTGPANELAAEYEGPLPPFVLDIEYVPTPGLIFAQLPLTARMLAHPFENTVDRFPFWLLLGALGLGLLLLANVQPNVASHVLSIVGWMLVSLALVFSMHGVFGLLVVAAMTMLVSSAYRPLLAPRYRTGVGSLGSLGLVLVAMMLDRRATDLFDFVISLDVEVTPITPLILLLLGLVAVAALRQFHGENRPLLVQIQPAILLGLLSVSIFDVLQKSLLSLIVVGLGVAFIASRISNAADAGVANGLRDRLQELWGSRVVPFGIVVLIVFMAQQDYRSTTTLLAGGLGLWADALLLPTLSIVTIVLQFASIGLLFVMLFPVLPFRSGFLKAVTFSLFLWLVFVVGLGADDRLLANWEHVAIGRFIYYLSVPLLIGLYADVNKVASARLGQQGESEDSTRSSFDTETSVGIGQIQRIAGGVAAIATLVTPAAYTLVTGVSVVTPFFQLMAEIAALSAGG
jgi:hypothetical protein